MAQELELIVDMLRDMREANRSNTQSFNKLLASIEIAIKTSDSDLLKIYIEELAKTIDEKYYTTSNNFAAIDNALKNIKKHVKDKGIKNLIDTFSKNLKSILPVVKSQNNIFSTVKNTKDITEAITILKKQSEINYQNIIDTLSTDINAIISFLSGTDASEQVLIQFNIIKDYICNIVENLNSYQKRDIYLEKLLAEITTNESLKLTRGLIDSIIEKNNEISEKFSTLANKKDIEELKQDNDPEQKKIFSTISNKTEAIENLTEDIKKTLAKVTQDIEKLTDVNTLKVSMQELFASLNELSLSITNANIIDNFSEIDNKLISLNTEMHTIQNIISDLNDVINTKIYSIINDISFEKECFEIKSHISKMLTELPHKEDIDKLLDAYEKNRTSLKALEETTNSISNKLQYVADRDSLVQLSSKADDIEKMIDTLNFDSEFESLYNKTAEIKTWLAESNIQENSEKILSKIDSKSEQKEALVILETVEKIVTEIEELSKNMDVKKVNRTVAEVYQIIEELKNDFINTTDAHNNTIVEKLSELQKTVSQIVEKEDFEEFTSDLKTFVEQTVTNSTEANNNFEDIKSYQDIIINKLNNIDISSVKEFITEQISPVEEKLVTISEYLNALGKKDSEDIKEAIAEIKEILENKKSNFKEIEQDNSDLVKSIESYINEIKIVLDTSDKDMNHDLTTKFSQLEQILYGYQSTNENALTAIIAKLEEYQNNITPQESNSCTELQASFAEILEIKEKISALSESFKTLNYEKDSTENNTSLFVSEILNELGANLEDLTENFDNKLQHGFAYNAELIEEKTLVILDFIKELRHANSENIDLYERLTVTDNKLMDFKQELELINTDITNNLNSKTDELLQELEPIKEMMSAIAANKNNLQNEEVKSNLEILHDSVQDDLLECTKYSKSTFDKLNDTYEQISKDLSTTENNLRDFILGDIDSVIIKIDNLRSDLEENLTKIAPPEAENMKEFRTFVEQINTFKTEQFEVLENIKDSINENINLKHEELKSMLTVSLNNEEIINAIDSLKACLKSKIKEFNDIENNDFEILGTNQFEEAFESDKNTEIIKDIKNDFDKFASLISELSDRNPEIDEVLEVIKSKMDTISVAKSEVYLPEIIEDTDDDIDIQENQDSENNDETLIGAGNFDFIKALDLLKQDIRNLHQDVEKIISKEEQKQAATTLKTIPTLGNDNLLVNLNNKIELLANSVNQKDWLEEIKTYIAGDQIQSMLEEISGKIDILTLSDNTEWVDEIKQALEQINTGETTAGNTDPQIQSMLALINEKIDILAAADDYNLIEEVKEAIDRLDSNSNNIDNSKTEKMLNLINEKIDIIASDDNNENFEDIRETLFAIEDKLNNDNKKSNEPDFNNIKDKLISIENMLSEEKSSEALENFEDLKYTLANIQDKLNEENSAETIETLDNIKNILSNIQDKLSEDNASATLSSLDDIKYTLINVDEKVDSVKKLSESDAKITSMLEALNHKIDTIAESENTINSQGFDDVKNLIMAQMDYIESLEKNNKTDALKKCLKELTLEVNNLATSDNTKQIQKTIREMKESIMAAVVTIFEQVSFVEETEEIKDFVEEKTYEINQNLATVTSQLKQITNANEDPDYIYSMQDIESDLAKLRLALNQLQTSEQEIQTERLSSILENINNIGSTVEDLQNSLTKEEFFDIKIKFDKVNTDIKSLNALTHQLIAASDKSYNDLNNTFEDFGKVITTQLTTKVDKVTKLLETSHASDKVMRQALIYMGEWIDSASESMNKISSNSDEIIDIKSAIEGLKQSVPEQTGILNSIEEKFDEQQERLAFFEKQISKLGSLEEKFEAQEERIDRLEMSIEKILSAVEDIDDSKVTRKIDKIDKQIAKLSTNIEKLASYVD